VFLVLPPSVASSSARVLGEVGRRKNLLFWGPNQVPISSFQAGLFPVTCTVVEIMVSPFVALFWTLVILFARDLLPRLLTKGWHFNC
jgi:hypothetical protein